MIPVQQPSLGREELAAVGQVFESGWLGMGDVSTAFEDALRSLLGARHVLAVNTGTSALHLALEAIDHEPGDEVIVPSLTFVATIQAIDAAGMKPVFCEVCEHDLNIDVDDAAKRITPRTRAILPVHYGGTVCDMDRLLMLAQSHHLRVIEDAAHAFGSFRDKRPVGILGDITCFSFDPIKNITCGEGGAIATEDDTIAQRIKTQRVLGIDRDAWARRHAPRPWAYGVESRGFRYHLPNFNAAVGLEQLKKADHFRRRKQQIVRAYDASLADLPHVALLQRRIEETFPFSYVVRITDGRRDQLMNHLRTLGVGSGVHYIPNHLQPLYASSAESLPVTEQLFEQIITLPLFVTLTDAQVQHVIDSVRSFFASDATTPTEDASEKVTLS